LHMENNEGKMANAAPIGGVFFQSRLWDLNPGPMLYESIALPLS
jgi:hypothetical protein